MPAKNPRLSVVLTPSVAATLAALADASGESASSLVRGLLAQVEPALQRMLQLMLAAKAAQGNIGSGVAATLSRVVDDLEHASAASDVLLEQVQQDLVSSAEEVKSRRRGGTRMRAERAPGAAAPEASTPVPVTRGSGGPTKGSVRGRKAGHGRAL